MINIITQKKSIIRITYTQMLRDYYNFIISKPKRIDHSLVQIKFNYKMSDIESNEETSVNLFDFKVGNSVGQNRPNKNPYFHFVCKYYIQFQLFNSSNRVCL